MAELALKLGVKTDPIEYRCSFPWLFDLLIDLVASLPGAKTSGGGGVGQIAVHAESATHLDRTLGRIREHGIKAGVALNPHTPVETLRYVIDRIDFVLVMTVSPGFAGQKLAPSGLAKLKDTRRFLDYFKKDDIPIEVEGDVNFDNIPDMIGNGADILVAGTSSLLSKQGTLDENAAALNEAVARGLVLRETGRGMGIVV